MAEDIQIRQVTVEFLRPGPAHNQLLSPLTRYLVICGNSMADTVTVPYEHDRFEWRLKDLRYESGDPEDRLGLLHEIGTEMGKILGSVPGLPGALTGDPRQAGPLIHLRLTLSASELALLPFEMAKVPVGPAVSSDSWLAIQTRPPVCLTRNVRTVSPEGVVWPHKPRVLFVSAHPNSVPFKEHRESLLEAIKPFRYPETDDPKESRGGAREQFGELLTILKNPTLDEVLQECRANRYTHVHILMHGDLDETSRGSYGLALRGTDDEDDDSSDVVSGERFASALTSVGEDRIHRPTVVTVASCDSGNVGSVFLPGASFAHALHQSGIPFVVASQFPLSKEGSVPFAATLYKGLLWGQNPLLLLQQLRAELHARYTATWHDWASLVVYEALPLALNEQLEKLKYHQARSAMNAALQGIDLAVQARNRDALRQLDDDVAYAVDRLPLNGHYAVECLGLRASSNKRLAQAAHTLASQEAANGGERWREPYDLLDQAVLDYDRAVRGFLVNEAHAVQRTATLHWVLVQLVSLSMVLGKDEIEGAWEAAKLCSDRYCDHPLTEERAWAHGSLAELWLVRLGAAGLSPDQRKEYSQRALHHAKELIHLYPRGDEFPITSTCRQFARYISWWNSSHFKEELDRREIRWAAPWDGEPGEPCLLETARQLVNVLQRNRRRAMGSPAPASPQSSSGPPGGGGGGGPVPGGGGPSGPEGSSAKSGAQETPVLSARAPKGKATARVKPPRRREGTFFDVDLLPAGHGDSLWIEYGDASETHRWLIDCGAQKTAKTLVRRAASLPESEKRLELFVMTHIDSDHIGGALPFFKAVQDGLRIDEVWFNGWRHLSGRLGARQGEMFSTAIQDFGIPWNAWREGGPIVVDGGELPVHELPGGMKLTLLSPGPAQLRKLAPLWMRELKRYALQPGARVDYSKFLKGTPSTSTDIDQLADTPFSSDDGVPNGTSIALLAEYGGAAVLFGADAHVPVLAESIRTLLGKRGGDRLKLDAFKVSHHASQNNLSKELLDLLDCKRYLVSTNGNYFCHPDRQAIGRIIKYGGDQPVIYFNYLSRYNEVWARPDLQEKHRYSAVYPEDEGEGTTVSILTENAAGR